MIKRNSGVKKCLDRFAMIADDIEEITSSTPTIARISMKDLTLFIAKKRKLDYTNTYSLVSIYCKLRAADGCMVISRGVLGKIQLTSK